MELVAPAATPEPGAPATTTLLSIRILIRESLQTALIALLIFVAMQLTVQNYRVQGPSMQPTLVEGEFLLVNKAVYWRFDAALLDRLLPFYNQEGGERLFPFHSPRRGEVIIFHYPDDVSRDFVKRVIGLPGETVEIQGGRVILDGRTLDEPYLDRTDNSSMDALVVPQDSYFVMGDNRPASNDSRDFGVVPTDLIVGRAWVTFWPQERWQALSTLLSGVFGLR